MSQSFIAVIMAGGKGQRFWPLSTESFPKQFLDLERCGRTLLQSTFDRLLLLTEEVSGIYVATSETYLPLVEQQLPELPRENIIIEPVARDSAPAIALATLKIKQLHGDRIIGFFPSDHRIANSDQFYHDVSQGIALTETTRGIVTLGITPTHPATGFGYIKAGESVDNGFKVAQFVEKPPLDKARQYVHEGGYWWNAGMFLWHTSTLVEELQKHMPQLLDIENALKQGILSQVFPTMPKISIDYAVMEKTTKAYVVPTRFSWDDLGDWTALDRLIDRKHNDLNTVVGTHIGFETQNNIIYSENDQDVIVTVGVENLVIVKQNNTILIAHKDKVQDIKKVLQDQRVAQFGRA